MFVLCREDFLTSYLKDFEDLLSLIRELRAPGGCHWEQKQTHRSLKRFLIEEAHELAEVLDDIHSDENLLQNPILKKSLVEEIGDILYNLLLHATIAEEKKTANLSEIILALKSKLMRRHPRVDSGLQVGNDDQELEDWRAQKKDRKSLIGRLPNDLPALYRVFRVFERLSRFGFKRKIVLKEAMSDFLASLQQESPMDEAALKNKLVHCVFEMVQFAYTINLNLEDALIAYSKRFEKQFRFVEQYMRFTQQSYEELPPSEQENIWKKAEKFEQLQLWALFGGAGSGKSSVRKILESHHFLCIDFDVLNQEAWRDPEVLRRIQDVFQTSDKSIIKRVIFNDLEKKQQLEAIVHPHIEMLFFKHILNYLNQKVIVCELSLLVESGKARDFDKLILVDADPHLRKFRLMMRDQISEDLAEKIINQQLPSSVLKNYANIVINNSTSLPDLESQLRDLNSLI